MSVARIRLELLPHAAHGGKVARDNAETASVQLAASVREASTATEKPLAFFHAEADHREPRYSNGYEVPGVLDGWQTAKDRKSTPQTAIFALDAPVELTPEAELKIVVRTDQPAASGCRFHHSDSIPMVGPVSTTKNARPWPRSPLSGRPASARRWRSSTCSRQVQAIRHGVRSSRFA